MPPRRTFVLLALALTWLASFPQTPTPFERAARYSAERDGDAVLVFRHDSLVLEDYQGGYDPREPHGLASGTKAFACALAALGQGDGLFRLDEPLSRWLPEFRGDSVRARITLRQVLTLTSGLQPDITTPDDYRAATRLPLVTIPGQRFAYGGSGFHVLNALLAARLRHEDAVAYLNRRVLQPLEIPGPLWARDASGQPNLASGAAMTARDWGKFGVLLLYHGLWRGQRLIPLTLGECFRGSPANPWFGIGLWLNAREPTRATPPGVVRVGVSDRRLYATDLPAEIYLAAGTGGQRLYLIPSAGLVIVRFGHNAGPEFKDDEFLRIALGRR